MKINAIEVPEGAGSELEKRFANRLHAVDGQPVPSILDLRGALRLRRPGAPVMLDVVRNGGHWPMRATLGAEAA